MLDARRGVFFAHIPKTGGSSIEFAHGFAEAADVTLRHHNEAQLRRHLEQSDRPPVITLRFVVVRNVVDRLVSTFRHRQRTLDKRGIGSTLSFDDYVGAIREHQQGADFPAHGSYVYRSESDRQAGGAFLFDRRHVEPFDWWVGEAREDYVVIRFETLDADYRTKVAPITGVGAIPHRNPTPWRFRARKVRVSRQAKRLIEQGYADEIERFSMAV